MSTPAPSPELSELARAHGVATEYWDWQGNHVVVSESTIVTVLAALGVDASTADRARAALEAAELRSWRQVLPPVVVCRQGWTPWVPVHLDDGASVQVWVTLEGGARREVRQVDRWVESRQVDGRAVGEATFELPGDLPLGWHTLHARLGSGTVSTPLVVTPARLTLPPALAEDHRAWGLMTQLYSVRSRRSWGVGDLADLGDMAAWAAADLGADFVLVNPLHAAEPVPPMEPSPYLPTTRRFVNPIYVRVEDIPEVAYMSAAERQFLEWHGDDARALNESDTIDRDAAWGHKLVALRHVFHQPRSARRERAFAAFCEREGQGLVDFATWCALADKLGLPWTRWPEELHDPRGEAVARMYHDIAEDVQFHCWLQWVVDQQLDQVQHDAREAGMGLGVVHDLAVGVHPEGADAWGLADALARDVTVGAPPDQYNQMGQDWSQPPWRPDRLEELGYAPYRDMLRTVLRHAGGIRVDHVIGLFRLWWVPAGKAPSEGTYVRYDHEALVGILALEAHRAGALVVGEDLGVVEPWARDYLKERGILGTSILWFEKDEGGAPLPAERYRELCLATVTTHDLPPTAGYLAGEHIDLRERLGLLTRPLEEERAADEAARAEVLEVLRERGLLREGGSPHEVIEALHRFLSWTPARLLGVAVPDMTGDRRAMNQPGTDEEYPNWRLPLADGNGKPVLLEDLMASRWARRLARCVAQR
ncbi:4-alpha-glucanotransferase [Oryzihumus leptocrescens]|uniref:4-alpha-glucanotransferase n=1 Tax=Oryzihumus leptocrescens TaxID=297536 RepID=A0A542ZH67_9MICO|nr:4-alpha-glucanotransferase [Oryzihumus leptocrescens]TQL59639.1 4-alpha-glucanotransferase [Oryzihumus leptocrescens]